MEQVGKLQLFSLEEVLDEKYGKIGTPARDEFEQEVLEAIESHKMGEALKETREAQCLTRKELGERTGLTTAQIARVEQGRSQNLSWMGRIFCALGIEAPQIELGSGRLPLW